MGGGRVFFLDEEGVQHSLPVGWTDAVEPDVFVVMAAGSCPFRIDDLLEFGAFTQSSRPR